MGNNFGNIVNLIFALIGAIIVVGISIKVIINIFSKEKLPLERSKNTHKPYYF